MPAGMISGKVNGPKGKAIADARVYFTSGPAPLPDIAALTDEKGSFSLPIPRAGKYEIQVVADGFAAQTIPVDATTGKKINLEVNLKTDDGR